MKHRRYPIIFVSLLLAGSSVMCSFFSSPYLVKPNEKDKQATMDSLEITISALEKEAVTATPAPTVPSTFATMVKPPNGAISGKLSYPSESMPPLRIVAFNVETSEVFVTEEYESGVYGMQGLPAGMYHVVAYPVDQPGWTQTQTWRAGTPSTFYVD